MEQQYMEIEQPLYSRMIVGGGDEVETSFFGNYLGQFGKNGEMIERVDTNMYNSSVSLNLFRAIAIRFRETVTDRRVKEHLLKTAHFRLTIVDQDVMMYPIHLMDNYYYFFEKKFVLPITLNPYENFRVELRYKAFDTKFQLTCELVGLMRRRS